MTQAIWKAEDYANMQEKNSSLSQFIEDNGKVTYIVTYNDERWQNGGFVTQEVTEEKRLFNGNKGVGYLRKGGRTHGYCLDIYNLIQVAVKTVKRRKTDEQVFQDRMTTLLNHLSKFNLWEEIQEEVKLLKVVGEELSMKCYNEYWWWNRDKKDDETVEEYNTYLRNKLKSREELVLAVIEKVKGTDVENQVKQKLADNEGNKFQVSEHYCYYKYIDKSLFEMYSYSKVFSLFKDVKSYYKHPIKKMTFHQSKWNKSNTERIVARINECMTKKESCHESGRNGYDVSFEYNANSNRAFYSEEYKNCSNGKYYIALNDTHALFIEYD